MVGFLTIETSMQVSKLHLGYRTIQFKNYKFNGHEFHYSTCKELDEITKIGKVTNTRNMIIDTPIYKLKNVIASYIHFYWGENVDLLKIIFE